ncbi:MAG: ATP-binding protein [Minicystis sp.]
MTAAGLGDSQPTAAWAAEARSFLLRHGVAACAVILAAAVRYVLGPQLGLTLPFVFFFPAIFVASRFGGLGAGLSATALSSALSAYLFLPPIKSFAVAAPGDVVGLLLFAATGVAISWLDEAGRRSRHALLAALARETRSRSRITKAITDNASLGLVMMDARQRCTFMNPAAERITGYTFAEVAARGCPLHDIVHHTRPDGTHFPMDECPIDRALPQRMREQGHDVFVRRDGTFYPVAFTASPIIEDDAAVGTIIEVEDITERMRAAEELRAAIRLRDDFLSIASHELRTPLTALQLHLQGMRHAWSKRDGGDIERFLRKLEKATRQTERLGHLVDDLLDVSRISAGKLSLQREPLDLGEVAREVADRHAAEARAAGCTITLELAPSVTGEWDRLRLEQVLANLITNAIKYGPGQRIEVAVEARGAAARVSVRDHGMGIRPEDAGRIFGRFERAVSSRNYGGLGLGLFISQQIVEAHGGAIDVESEPGEGSVFTVTIPRGPRAQRGVSDERAA